MTFVLALVNHTHASCSVTLCFKLRISSSATALLLILLPDTRSK